MAATAAPPIPAAANPAGTAGKTAPGALVAKGAAGVSFWHSLSLFTTRASLSTVRFSANFWSKAFT